MAVGNRVHVSFGLATYLEIARAAGTGTYAMAAQNYGIASRHQAESTAAVTGVRIYWGTISAPGTVTVTYQTIDATTGKPNGVYDANATWTGTPTAGWQDITFASAPTTARTRGTAYAVVVITATAGTTHTIRTYAAGNSQRYPASTLTTTDGSTWAETNAVLCGTVKISGAEELNSLHPFSGTSIDTCYGTRAAGATITVPAGMVVDAISCYYVSKSGTLDGDFRVRVLDVTKEPCAIGASGYIVATGTSDKDDLANCNNRTLSIMLSSPWTTTAGTFRVVFDQTSGSSSANYIGVWRLSGITGVSYTNMISCTTTDNTADPITWTDTDTDVEAVELVQQSFTAPASGGGGPLVGPGRLIR